MFCVVVHGRRKAKILGIVGSLTSLAKRGNERSSVWLALAVIFSELSTCQHHKNELKAREMEMTAEQFETLQMYNQMKKEKVVEPDSDAQASTVVFRLLREGNWFGVNLTVLLFTGLGRFQNVVRRCCAKGLGQLFFECPRHGVKGRERA